MKVQYNTVNEFPDSSYEMIKPLPFVSPNLLDDAKAWLAGECSTPRSMVVAEAFTASPWCYHKWVFNANQFGMTAWPNSNGVCFERYCALHIFKSKFQQSFSFKLQSCVDSLRNEKWRGFWTWKRTIRTLPLTNSGVIHGEQEGAMYPWIGDSEFGIKILMVTHFLPSCLILLTWLLGVTNCMASEQTLLHHKVLKIASVADAHSSKMLRAKALDTLITTPTSTTLPKELGGGTFGDAVDAAQVYKFAN